MMLTFCTKYSFDEKKRQSRLASIGLGEDEYKLAEQLQRNVIKPNLDEIVIQLFRMIQLDDEAGKMFVQGFRSDKLTRFLYRYLTTLGKNFSDGAYFEQRLRVGIAHINAGVSFIAFQLAFRILQQILLDHVPENIKNRGFLSTFILKITSLDLVIATEAFEHYRLAQNPEAAIPSRGSVQQLLSSEQLNALLAANWREASGNCETYVGLAAIDDDQRVEQCYGQQTARDARNGVVQRMLTSLRPGDGLGQFDDEHFLIVLSNTTYENAYDICRRVMDKVALHPFSADKMTIPVTISIILTSYSHPEIHDEVLPRLMQALTKIQEQGINQLELVTDADTGG